LNNIFGNYRAKGVEKGGYVLNRNVMTCADLSRIINSDQVQSKLRLVKKSTHVHDLQKKNPLKNRALMKKLNPFNQIRREAERKAQEDRHKKRVAGAKAHRKDKAVKLERRREMPISKHFRMVLPTNTDNMIRRSLMRMHSISWLETQRMTNEIMCDYVVDPPNNTFSSINFIYN